MAGKLGEKRDKYKEKRERDGVADNCELMRLKQRPERFNDAMMQTYGLPLCDFSYCKYYRLRHCYGTRMEYVGCPYRQYVRIGEVESILAMYDRLKPTDVENYAYDKKAKQIQWTCPACGEVNSYPVLEYKIARNCYRCGKRIDLPELPEEIQAEYDGEMNAKIQKQLELEERQRERERKRKERMEERRKAENAEKM